jgi:hypothetical protein
MGAAEVAAPPAARCWLGSARPLIDRSDSLLAVVDAQHGRGVERMTRAGVEYNHFKGLVFEWLRTIDYAREVYGVAVDRFGPFPVDAHR